MAERIEFTKVGVLETAAGGTRTAVKLNRPWQAPIAPAAPCPFESEEKIQKDQISSTADEGGWRVFKNAFTPFPFHLLITPFTCWPEEELRRLGGKEKIAAALNVASENFSVEDRELWLGVHVGPLAGQNVSHLHYHLLQPFGHEHKEPRALAPISRNNKFTIYESSDGLLSVAAGGHRAGQCLIFPNTAFFLREAVNSFAETINAVIATYNEKMQSVQGMAPDFMLGLAFSPRGLFRYGYYLPILNHWGFTEYFALLEATPLILPWPHEKTVEHIKG